MTLTVLEKTCLDSFRSGQEEAERSGAETDESSWLRFALGFILAAGRVVRVSHLANLDDSVVFKSDGSPVTRLEPSLETLVDDHLELCRLKAILVGEESGGTLPERGWGVAIDPVDGTWSLVNRTGTHATSLAIFKDGTPIIGVVLNPSTGEIAYCVAGNKTRLLQLGVFGEQDGACDLPPAPVDSAAILINVHPGRQAARVIDAFYQEWSMDRVRMIRSVGGAPAWGLVEAAKSRFVYLNLWPGRPAEPYDLAAGALIVRGAGGDIIGLDGSPADPLGHRGPFIAGVDQDARNHVAEVAASALS